MRRSSFLTAVLILTVFVKIVSLAQTQTGTNPPAAPKSNSQTSMPGTATAQPVPASRAPVAPAKSVPIYVTMQPNPGVVINQGAVVGTGPVSPPLLATPIVNLGTVALSPVGASNATANNPVGAGNSTLSNVTAPVNVVNTQAEFSNPGTFPANAQPAVLAGGEQTGAPFSPPATATAFNRGIGRFNSVYAGKSGLGRTDISLGEAAATYKHTRSTRAARVYTNDDIARINQQSGVRIGGAPSATAGKAVGNIGGITGAVQAGAAQSSGNVAPGQAAPAAQPAPGAVGQNPKGIPAPPPPK